MFPVLSNTINPVSKHVFLAYHVEESQIVGTIVRDKITAHASALQNQKVKLMKQA